MSGNETGVVLYMATEIVASGFQAGADGAQHTRQYVRIASSAQPRLEGAQ